MSDKEKDILEPQTENETNEEVKEVSATTENEEQTKEEQKFYKENFDFAQDDEVFKLQLKNRFAEDKAKIAELKAKYQEDIQGNISDETKERNLKIAKLILLSTIPNGIKANKIAKNIIKDLKSLMSTGSILDDSNVKLSIEDYCPYYQLTDNEKLVAKDSIGNVIEIDSNESYAKIIAGYSGVDVTKVKLSSDIKVSDVLAEYHNLINEASKLELGSETFKKIQYYKKDLNRTIPLQGPIDPTNGKEIIVSLKNVDITFGSFKAVKDASFNIYKGETFALVGESGSGKTTIGRAIIRINPISNGEIRYKGMKISGKISHKADREVVRNIQMIFQDPAASLNERATIEYIVSEGLSNFHLYNSEKERIHKVENIIKEVGLLPEHLTRYPHEFSGGQRQRVGIARSIVMEPEFVIADEPISALDVSIRAQVLNLLKKFQHNLGITYLFIAHDLSIVRFISDRIAVIYLGNIVEIAETEELFLHPMHPYTKSLLSAIPVPDPEIEKNKKLFVYDPSVHHYEENKPSLRDIGHGHFVFCNDEEFDSYKAIRNKTN